MTARIARVERVGGAVLRRGVVEPLHVKLRVAQQVTQRGAEPRVDRKCGLGEPARRVMAADADQKFGGLAHQAPAPRTRLHRLAERQQGQGGGAMARIQPRRLQRGNAWAARRFAEGGVERGRDDIMRLAHQQPGMDRRVFLICRPAQRGALRAEMLLEQRKIEALGKGSPEPVGPGAVFPLVIIVDEDESRRRQPGQRLFQASERAFIDHDHAEHDHAALGRLRMRQKAGRRGDGEEPGFDRTRSRAGVFAPQLADAQFLPSACCRRTGLGTHPANSGRAGQAPRQPPEYGFPQRPSRRRRRTGPARPDATACRHY